MEFREADRLGEGGGEALFPLLGPHLDWSQVSRAAGEGSVGSRLEPLEPGGNGLGEESSLHLGKREGRGLLRSENSSISGAHFTRGESMAFGDKGTERFWGALREVDKES